MNHESKSLEPTPKIDGGEATDTPDEGQQIDSAELGRLIREAYRCSPSAELKERMQELLASSSSEDKAPDSQ